MQVKDTSKEEKTHTEGRVKTLIKLLQRKAKDWKNFFVVVTNPESFSVNPRISHQREIYLHYGGVPQETVENVFDLSFVVKLGKAEMKIIDDTPFVSKFHKPANQARYINEKDEERMRTTFVKYSRTCRIPRLHQGGRRRPHDQTPRLDKNRVPSFRGHLSVSSFKILVKP